MQQNRRRRNPMRAHRLNVTIAEDHQLLVDLPGDFPPGPAEVIILTEIPETKNIVRLGGVLHPSIPPSASDPIADALDELREERAELLEKRARRYSSEPTDDP
jgi:hypothetical protein